MADILRVETGSMPPGANGYVSVEAADEWHFARGSNVWPPAPATGPDPNQALKEAAVILAADYLNGLRWKGRKAAAGRLMAWPRLGATDGDGRAVAENSVPPGVRAANCYLAGLAFAETDLQPVLERGGRIQSEQAGNVRITYFGDAKNRDIYTALEAFLAGLALNGGTTGPGRGLECGETGRG